LLLQGGLLRKQKKEDPLVKVVGDNNLLVHTNHTYPPRRRTYSPRDS
jgi:hypothetical protein